VIQRFYTYPPFALKWKWILRKIYDMPQPLALHEIVDIGIYDLLNEPYYHSKEKIKDWKKLKTDGWKVVPDIPDIQGEFDAPVDYDNTELSWELLIDLYDPLDVHQMPVIQSRFKDVNSLECYCDKFIREYGQVDKIGVGSLCKMDNIAIATEMLQLVRNKFPDAWMHVFGLRWYHMRKNINIVDSYDTMAWTLPRGKGRPSCPRGKREQYFIEYLDTITPLGYKI